MNNQNKAAMRARLQAAPANCAIPARQRLSSALLDAERLQNAMAEIERVRAEIRLVAALDELERAADRLAGLACDMKLHCI